MSRQEELARLAGELALHARWALHRGEREVPLPRPASPAEGFSEAAAPDASAEPVQQPPRAAPAPTSPPAETQAAPPLVALARRLEGCTRCPLHVSRSRIVFGAGAPDARLVFVGEGPGAEEDAQGLPFVGPAGQLLTDMIGAMGLSREQVYICNVVKCRPPGNRNPAPEEMDACGPFLREQILAVRPEAIVALGRVAAQALLRTDAPISKLRGSWHAYEGIPLLPTFHPAYLLRSPGEKRKAWQDLQEVMRRLDLPLPGR